MNIKQKNKKLYIVLTALPVIIIALIIFMFSAQKAEFSSQASGQITGSFINSFIPRFDNMDAEKQQSVHHVVEVFIRKAAHFSEFAALGFFVFLHFRLYIKNKTFIASWATCITYAFSDEFHQFFVADRAPRMFDVLIDSVGALFGILVLIFMLRIISKRKSH